MFNPNSRPDIADPQMYWKRFDRDQNRRNRLRLIRIGTIVPAYGMKPQMMVKTAEGWKPEIKTF